MIYVMISKRESDLKRQTPMTLPKLRPTFAFDEERLNALRAIAPEAFADGKINWER